jgi:hypothetical protein
MTIVSLWSEQKNGKPTGFPAKALSAEPVGHSFAAAPSIERTADT